MNKEKKQEILNILEEYAKSHNGYLVMTLNRTNQYCMVCNSTKHFDRGIYYFEFNEGIKIAIGMYSKPSPLDEVWQYLPDGLKKIFAYNLDLLK